MSCCWCKSTFYEALSLLIVLLVLNQAGDSDKLPPEQKSWHRFGELGSPLNDQSKAKQNEKLKNNEKPKQKSKSSRFDSLLIDKKKNSVRLSFEVFLFCSVVSKSVGKICLDK